MVAEITAPGLPRQPRAVHILPPFCVPETESIPERKTAAHHEQTTAMTVFLPGSSHMDTFLVVLTSRKPRRVAGTLSRSHPCPSPWWRPGKVSAGDTFVS